MIIARTETAKFVDTVTMLTRDEDLPALLEQRAGDAALRAPLEAFVVPCPRYPKVGAMDAGRVRSLWRQVTKERSVGEDSAQTRVAEAYSDRQELTGEAESPVTSLAMGGGEIVIYPGLTLIVGLARTGKTTLLSALSQVEGGENPVVSFGEPDPESCHAAVAAYLGLDILIASGKKVIFLDSLKGMATIRGAAAEKGVSREFFAYLSELSSQFARAGIALVATYNPSVLTADAFNASLTVLEGHCRGLVQPTGFEGRFLKIRYSSRVRAMSDGGRDWTSVALEVSAPKGESGESMVEFPSVLRATGSEVSDSWARRREVNSLMGRDDDGYTSEPTDAGLEGQDEVYR